MTAGFNLPDDFSQREFDRYWASDVCDDCRSEPCRCDDLDLEDDVIDDKDWDKDEFKEEFENG